MGARGPLPKVARPGTSLLPPAAPANLAAAGPVPPPPSWLGDIASAEYLRIVAETSTLTSLDAGLLATYAQAFGEIAEHTEKLVVEGYVTKGDRGSVLNPRVRALDRARAALLAGAAALGLTPASRLRMPPPAEEKSEEIPTTGPAAFAAMYGNDPA